MQCPHDYLTDSPECPRYDLLAYTTKKKSRRADALICSDKMIITPRFSSRLRFGRVLCVHSPRSRGEAVSLPSATSEIGSSSDGAGTNTRTSEVRTRGPLFAVLLPLLDVCQSFLSRGSLLVSRFLTRPSVSTVVQIPVEGINASELEVASMTDGEEARLDRDRERDTFTTPWRQVREMLRRTFTPLKKQ